MRHLVLTTIMGLTALPAAAQDSAILLGVDQYKNLDLFEGGTAVMDTAEGFAAAGYVVDALANETADDMRSALARFIDRTEDAERLVMVLSGRFVTDEDRTWLIAPGARKPTLFYADKHAVSLESVLQVMAFVPRQSIVMLAYDEDDTDTYDLALRGGIGDLDIPQGVTVMTGSPRAITRAITDGILRPNTDVLQVARSVGLDVAGYRNTGLVMQENEPVRAAVVSLAGQTAAWRAAQARDTLAAYRSYLSAYPRGIYVAEARAAMDKIENEPNRAERLQEEALGLNREERRTIQRNLATLGHDPRGIDGVFGPGTRGAIASWQTATDLGATTYLTGNQIDQLKRQAAARAAEIEAEAARERIAQLARDNAFWERTGAQGGERKFRQYLERYPDGVHADTAKAELDKIEQAKLDQAVRKDRDAWRATREDDSRGAYRVYLRDFPDGVFKQEAQARLQAIQDELNAAPAQGRAQASESELSLNAMTMGLVMGRLVQLGYDVGKFENGFDNRTRRAIREFQRNRNLEPTGFLDQAAIVQLLQNR